MTEEEKGKQQQAKSGWVGKLVVIGLIILVPAIVGVSVYRFVLRPMFAQPGIPTPPQDDAGERIPVSTVLVDFTGLRASVKVDDPSMPALLQYSVSLACANEASRVLVEGRRPYFESMLVNLHDSRPKEELTDPMAKEDRLRRAKQEANVLLERIQEEKDPSVRVIDVLYTEYTIINL